MFTYIICEFPPLRQSGIISVLVAVTDITPVYIDKDEGRGANTDLCIRGGLYMNQKLLSERNTHLQSTKENICLHLPVCCLYFSMAIEDMINSILAVFFHSAFLQGLANTTN